MKTINYFVTTTFLALALVFVSCSKDETDTPVPSKPTGDPETLTTFEKDGLVHLLQIEKMHHDLYNWIDAQFPGAVFAQLADIDGKFMDRLILKAGQYGIANPVLDKLPGEFEDPGIQNQYNDFVRLTIGDLEAMIENARVMEEEMIAAVREQQLNLCGNDDLREIYGVLIQQSDAQLNILDNELKGLIHINAPKEEKKED